MTTVNEVVDFWLDEVGPERWYDADEALDHEVRRRFEQLWWNTLNGANGLWLTYATGTLAYLILMDQMPRNMLRRTAPSFGSDRHALSASHAALHYGSALKNDEPALQFFKYAFLGS